MKLHEFIYKRLTLTVIFYILLAIILCVSLVKADYLSSIYSTEKVENDGQCDNNEWVWDKDCALSNEQIFKGDFFYTAWFMRLLLFVIIIAYLWKSKIFEALLMLGLATIMENQYGVTVTAVCEGSGYLKNFGKCFLPSQPVIGWFLGFIIIYFMIKKTIGKGEL